MTDGIILVNFNVVDQPEQINQIKYDIQWRTQNIVGKNKQTR